MVNSVLDFCVVTIRTCLMIFDTILEATQLKDLWIAAVCFALFVSIVLMPFRAGHPIGSGGLVGFVSDRVSTSRRDNKAEDNRVRWHYIRRFSRRNHND